MKKLVFAALLVLILSMPLGVLALTTQREIQQYKEPERVEWSQQAYGEIHQVQVGRVLGGAYGQGTYVAYGDELIKYKKKPAEQLLVLVSKGDEVRKDQVIAFSGAEKIKSSIDGVFEKAEDQGSFAYFVLRRLSVPHLEIDWPVGSTINVGQNLTDEQNKTYRIERISKISSGDHIKIYLQSSEEHSVGERFAGFLHDGDMIEDTVLISKDCIYQKSEDGPYYVSVVSEEGKFLEEREVSVGLYDSQNINVIGVEEGEFGDAGYPQLMIPFSEGPDHESDGN